LLSAQSSGRPAAPEAGGASFLAEPHPAWHRARLPSHHDDASAAQGRHSLAAPYRARHAAWPPPAAEARAVLNLGVPAARQHAFERITRIFSRPSASTG